MWVVVKIIVPFWIPTIYNTAPQNLGYPKRDHNFDNHPCKQTVLFEPRFEDCRARLLDLASGRPPFQGLGFGVSGFTGLGFRMGLGLRASDLGFRDLGF